MEKRLLNKTILITRGKNESKKIQKLFLDAGAKIVLFPTIKLLPINDTNLAADLNNKIVQTDFLIFTSVNAVKYFFCNKDIIEKVNKNITLKTACVGSATAKECKKHNLKVDILPKRFAAKGLIEEFAKLKIAGKKILIPGSAISRDELKVGLQNLGAEVEMIATYDNVVYPKKELMNEIEEVERQKPDVFSFTSPSAFSNFLAIMEITEPDKYFEGSIIAAIGPTTKEEVESKGVNALITPDEYSLQGLFESIYNFNFAI